MILNRGGHLNNKLAHSHNSQSDIPVGQQQRRKAAPQNKLLLGLSYTQGTALDLGGSPRPFHRKQNMKNCPNMTNSGVFVQIP